MGKYRIFIVDDNTWEEHLKVGVAAINDPVFTHPNNRNANSSRQSAMAEISGIRAEDILFFNRMGSASHPPEILGLYKAKSSPYFDNQPLYPGARHVKDNLPFRVEFDCLLNCPNPINIDEIWALKEEGKIWTIQQSRGDAVGVHACIGITRMEGKLLEKLLKTNNIVFNSPANFTRAQINKTPLPLDLRTDRKGNLHYEAVLLALLLEDFANGKHRDIFGDYDDFVPFVPMSSRKEIDILLLKYDEDDILWYQILELKADSFTMLELQRLIDYEKWLSRTRAKNALQVYSIALAFNFDDQVKRFVRGRQQYKDRPIRLIKYSWDSNTFSLTLSEEF